MNAALVVLGIGGAIAIGTMSPGPSFVMVARTAVASSRGHGLAAALGMGTGGVILATAALLGLQALLAAVPWLYVLLKVGGGAYLAYLGYRIWTAARAPLVLRNDDTPAASRRLLRTFLFALGTQLSNPKAAIVYGSVFASLLPADPSLGLVLTLPVVVFLIETAWYGIVAIALSAASPRDAYLRYKSWIDRSAAGVMTALGIRLIATAADA